MVSRTLRGSARIPRERGENRGPDKQGMEGLVKLLREGQNNAAKRPTSSAEENIRTTAAMLDDVDSPFPSPKPYRPMRTLTLFADAIANDVLLAPIAATGARAGVISQYTGLPFVVPPSPEDSAIKAAEAAAEATKCAIRAAYAAKRRGKGNNSGRSVRRKTSCNDALFHFTTRAGLSRRSAAHVALARGIQVHKREEPAQSRRYSPLLLTSKEETHQVLLFFCTLPLGVVLFTPLPWSVLTQNAPIHYHSPLDFITHQSMIQFYVYHVYYHIFILFVYYFLKTTCFHTHTYWPEFA